MGLLEKSFNILKNPLERAYNFVRPRLEDVFNINYNTANSTPAMLAQPFKPLQNRNEVLSMPSNKIAQTKKTDPGSRFLNSMAIQSNITENNLQEKAKEGALYTLGTLIGMGNPEKTTLGAVAGPGGKGLSNIINKGVEAYKETGYLSTKLLKKLEGKTEVSKQFIQDLTNSPDLKQVEKDLIRSKLGEFGIKYKETPKIKPIKVNAKTRNYNRKAFDDYLDSIEGDTIPATHETSLENAKNILKNGADDNEIFSSLGYNKKPDFYTGDDGVRIFFEIPKKEVKADPKVFGQKYFISLDTMDHSAFPFEGNGGHISSPFKKEWITDVVDKNGNSIINSDKINVQQFADSVKAELLPLKGTLTGKNSEGITLSNEVRGNVKNYFTRTWESPIKTSAGNVHERWLEKTDNYFGHTRIEDMVDNQTRRVIEVQSDLYQKGNLEREAMTYASRELPENVNWKGEQHKLIENKATLLGEIPSNIKIQAKDGSIKWVDFKKLSSENKDLFYSNEKANELSKLQQYNNPTAHFRMVREEIKQAAIDGKTKLQFPTGETAMKIEGLGNQVNFEIRGKSIYDTIPVTKDNLKIGQEIVGQGNNWIITDVLGDGKFKAVPKDAREKALNTIKEMYGEVNEVELKELLLEETQSLVEQFDISGKVDTNNPIYKFYEKDLGRYLTNNYKAKIVVDNKGVKWYEVDVNPEVAKKPIEAFGLGGLGLGLLLGKEKERQAEVDTEWHNMRIKKMHSESVKKHELIKQEQANKIKDEIRKKHLNYINSIKNPKARKTLNISEDEKNKVIATVIGEGIGEGNIGMQAILNNIINRAERGRAGGTLFGVVSEGEGAQYNAFSSSNKLFTKVRDYLRGKTEVSPKIKEAIQHVKNLLSEYELGNLKDIVNGNLNYLNPNITTESGKAGAGYNKRNPQKDIVIGNHVFWDF